jgi:hypothetical protein
MHLTGVDLFYWTAGFVGHFILLLVLWRRHRAGEFPIFTTWIASNLARSIVLAAVAHFEGRAPYYYTYWSLAIIDTVLQFGIVYEMYSQTFRPLGTWAKDVRGVLAWLLALSLVVAGMLTQMAKPHTGLLVQEVTIRGNLFSSAWMSELFVGMITISVRVGLPWKAHVARISQGLGIYSLFGVVIEAGNSYFGLDRSFRAYTTLSHLRITVYLCCLLYWTLMLWKNAPDGREMSAELRHHLAKLQSRAERDLQAIRTWRQK